MRRLSFVSASSLKANSFATCWTPKDIVVSFALSLQPRLAQRRLFGFTHETAETFDSGAEDHGELTLDAVGSRAFFFGTHKGRLSCRLSLVVNRCIVHWPAACATQSKLSRIWWHSRAGCARMGLISVHVPASVDVDGVVLHVGKHFGLRAKRDRGAGLKVVEGDDFFAELTAPSVKERHLNVDCGRGRSRITNLAADYHSGVGIFELFVGDLKHFF